MTEPVWTLALDKEDFKFSVAHFTLFDAGRAEPLHGHNYRVRVELAGSRLDPAGLLVAVEAVKQEVRALCARLDDRVLLPGASPWLELRDEGASRLCRFAGREYRLPAEETLVLPLANVSMELLARWLWEALAEKLSGRGLASLAMTVEESAGQACRYAAPLGG